MRGKAWTPLLVVPLLLFLTGQAPARAQNILVNPSFENWLLRMPVGWVTSVTIDSSSATRSTDAHTGSYALQLLSGDTSAFAVTTTIVSAGSYDFSAFAKSDDFLPGSFVISWLNMTGGSVGSPEFILVSRSATYREYARTVTAPDSAFFCVVTFVTTPLIRGITAYLDDVTLTPVASGVAGPLPLSQRFQLYPAQPNPFIGSTLVNYSLATGSVARLKVYDLVGNEVRTLVDDYKPAGLYTAFWNATDDAGNSTSPGVYFCRLEVGDRTLTQKLMLLGE